MKQTVEFELQDDVVTGGIRTATNFFVSSDYISGAVLRAGFVWNILAECPYAGEEINEKVNFVGYRAKPECANCANAEVCKKFSEMTFSNLYLAGTIPAPFTLHKCKAFGTVHSVMDTVAVNGRLVCPQCSGRMESVKGYVNRDSGLEKKVLKSLSVHTAIDVYTNTALDGSLFSIDAIKHGQRFYGYIDDCGTGMLEKGTVVRVGKLSSCGFGKLVVTDISEYRDIDIDETINSVNKFNAKFKNKLNAEGGREYASLLFTSDAVLELEKVESGVLSSSEYKEIWQRSLFGDGNILRVEKVFAQNFSYSGFDTSLKTDNDIERRKKPVIMTKRGSSILVSYDANEKEKALVELNKISNSGIGKDTEIGCGRVEVCAALHNIGIMEEGYDKTRNN